MNPRNGIIWAYRLILNREPTADEVAEKTASYTDPQSLRRALRMSREFATLLDRAGAVFEPHWEADWEDGVLWAYRILLRREPSESEQADHRADVGSLNDLRLRLLTTREFEVYSPGSFALTEFAIVNAFAPFPRSEPTPGAFRDIFGSTTQVTYLDRNWHNLAGYVYRSVPRHREAGLHGTSEWVGTLRSVLEARESWTVVELGAGWGPWLVASSKAACLRGIKQLNLIGVEGASSHYDFMIDNFGRNGIDPKAHRLFHAVIGPADEVALFPRLPVAEDDYGANAVFGDHEREAATMRGELEEVRSISIPTLLDDVERVDLLHIDIQGHEEDVIRSAIVTLNHKVRRIVIGTHSRSIEGHLFDLLHDHGWVCETEVPCELRATMHGNRLLVVDGEQVWRNERLEGSVGWRSAERKLEEVMC